MTPIPYLFLSLLGLLPRAAHFRRTANADSAVTLPPEFQQQLDDQAAQIAELQRQLATRSQPPEPESTGLLAILTQHAGLRLEDVRWRVLAGLDPEQAVAAALAQKTSDSRKTPSPKPKAAK